MSNKPTLLERSPFHRYAVALKSCPREIFSFHLFLTVVIFALSGSPKGWDEGSAASITQLASMKKSFGLTGSTASVNSKISNIVSLVNLGAGFGPLLSLPLNDRIGRVWSLRLWQLIYAVGIIIEVFATGHTGQLLAGRFIAGLGIGALTVVGPMAISEAAPAAIRGLLGLAFNIFMVGSQVIGIFSVFGCSKRTANNLQWQLPFIVQLIVPVVAILGSFLIHESPRYLVAKNKPQQALDAIVALRNLPATHPYVAEEFASILEKHELEKAAIQGAGLLTLIKETFTVPNYRRRIRVVIVAYLLAQFSGANSITNYLPTILGLIGVKSTDERILFTGGYSIAKVGCLFLASLFFVDVVGRRKSLMIGVTVQGLCQIYLSAYLKVEMDRKGLVSKASSKMAIAAIYINAFGWGIGLLPLPYLFGAELFPTRIRGVGGALSQSFHWLFYFGITKATPDMLTSMAGWGTFLFFACWCAIAFIYGYFMVPETSGRSLESMNKLFDYKWYEIRKNAYPTDDEVAAPTSIQTETARHLEDGLRTDNSKYPERGEHIENSEKDGGSA
ncbi:MFS quinate transporter [Pseudohyphozyma bogoriensis]|nr:MFS quinate transporter [Pseudohyphozyma bogoriensis]